MNSFIRMAVTVAVLLVAGGVGGMGEVRAADAVPALERACAAAQGRYETGWTWDVGSVAWGQFARCETAGVRISCQGSICHAIRRGADPRRATLVKDKNYSKHGVRVEARRSEFERVLSPVAMY